MKPISTPISSASALPARSRRRWKTLEQLHALHPAAIPFENLDPLMGVPVRLELRNLEQKLLFEKRGGYCFEHNLLFKAMLEDARTTRSRRLRRPRALEARRRARSGRRSHMRAGRRRRRRAPISPMSASAAVTLTAPLRLRADVEQETPHEAYRLIGGEPDWRLEAKIGEEWRALYVFDTRPRRATRTSRHERCASRSARSFRDNLIAARAEKGRRLDLRNTPPHASIRRWRDRDAHARLASPKSRDVLTGAVRHRAAARRQARPGARARRSRAGRARLMAPFVVNPDNVREFKDAATLLQLARPSITTRTTRSGSRSTRRARACPRSPRKRGDRRRPLLGLDRRHPQGLRRQELPAALHAARQEEHLEPDQRRQRRAADRGRPDDGARPRGRSRPPRPTAAGTRPMAAART